MMHILKIPNADTYIKLINIEGYRIATPRDGDKGYTVFIDTVTARGVRCEYIKFKTKKTAQNFCAKLAKDLEKVLHHARGH